MRLFDDGIFKIRKIYEIDAAKRNRALIHKSARLAEESVFGILRRFRFENRVYFTAVVHYVQNLGNRKLERA